MGEKIGLFESPTGTGKTLSIICASLTWLRENRVAKSRTSASKLSVEPAWVSDQMRARSARDATHRLTERHALFRRRLKNAHRLPGASRRRTNGLHDDFETADSDSDVENENSRRGVTSSSNIRVIFATRTHTQLSQFVYELRRTSFVSDARMKIAEKGVDETMEVPLSAVMFGSRRQTCVNDEVREVGSGVAISERCRELTEGSGGMGVEVGGKRKRSKNKCIYKNSNEGGVLRDRAIVDVLNIEELSAFGKKIGACPYFATRDALATGDVDVIGVPYSAVLHAATRESLGLEIDENTIVIFDEAHNVMKTVCDLHSCTMSRSSLEQTLYAITGYKKTYESRFSSRNLFRLRQLVALCSGLLSLVPARGTKGEARVEKVGGVLYEAKVDNINIFPLVCYMSDTQLCKKLRGFVDGGDGAGVMVHENEREADKECVKRRRDTKQSVSNFESFVRGLASAGEHGRVAIYPYRETESEKHISSEDLVMEKAGRLKLFMVQPGEIFANSMRKARAILLVGGTLSPREGIKQRLLNGMEEREIMEFECDHVVPRQNVMTRVCETGPTNGRFEFTYRSRGTFDMWDELGRAIEECVKEVKGGVVLFFTSYEVLLSTVRRWKDTGVMERMEKRKRIVIDERGCNDIFERFEAHVRSDGSEGAILAAVMGGRLSEGINFCDELGRMIIIIGMPFANARNVETKHMLSQLQNNRQRCEYLENECLTIVNQCIGRAVRHRHDFATIILMDCRYGRRAVIQKLPAFIRRDVAVSNSFHALKMDMRHFFARKRHNAAQI